MRYHYSVLNNKYNTLFIMFEKIIRILRYTTLTMCL